MGDGLDDDLLLGVGQLRVVVAAVGADEGVAELVHERADLRVGGDVAGDRADCDPSRRRLVEAVRRARDLLDVDA